MEEQNRTMKIKPQYNKIKDHKPFNIRFSNNNIITNNIKNNNNFYNKFYFKIKEEKNLFQNKTIINTNKDFLKPDKNNFIKAINFNNNLKNSDNKENKITFNNFNKIKKIRCCSQGQRNSKLLCDSENKNILNEAYENEQLNDIKDINLFFDKINKEFGDIGKVIKLNFMLDDKIKFEFNKNEFVLLKIIENELKEKNGIIIKEFIYKNQKLNVYKSLKQNNLEDNCIIKIII